MPIILPNSFLTRLPSVNKSAIENFGSSTTSNGISLISELVAAFMADKSASMLVLLEYGDSKQL